MGQRKLFYAKTKDNAVIHIDYVEKGVDREELLCPFCNSKVIAKQGETNTWHFAHEGDPCSHSYDKLDPEMRKIISGNELLDKFSSGLRSFSVSQIEVPQDSKEFQCPLCFEIGSKNYGMKWKGNLYICKDCFSNLSGNIPEKLISRVE